MPERPKPASTIPHADASLEREVVSRVAWRLLPFLLLLYVVAYLDRINVGFAALQMRQQLHFSDAVYGLGAGIFFAGYLVFQVPSNLLMQSFGARKTVATIMLLWGVVSCSMIFVATPRGFYTLRFLLGVAEAGFFPGMILYLKEWFPAAARARAIALFMTAGPISGIIGGPISGYLLGLQGRQGLAGWQWMFLLEGLPALALAAVVLFFLTDHPADAAWLSPTHRGWLLGELSREIQIPAAVIGTNFGAAFTNTRVWLLAFIYFGLNTCNYGISLWLPTVIRKASGVSNLTLGFMSAIPYLSAGILMILAGVHSDKTSERKWHVAVPAFAAAVALCFSAYTTSAILLLAALSVAFAGANSMTGPFWAISTGLFSGTAAAAGIALINSVGNLGGFFGPLIIGLVRNYSGDFKGGLLAVGAILGMGGAASLLLPSVKK